MIFGGDGDHESSREGGAMEFDCTREAWLELKNHVLVRKKLSNF